MKTMKLFQVFKFLAVTATICVAATLFGESVEKDSSEHMVCKIRIQDKDQEVSTEFQLEPGDEVHIVSEGTLNLGGGVLGIGDVILTADGDNAVTPEFYPAPKLRKNSLVCKINVKAEDGINFRPVFYQGGRNVRFTAKEQGVLLLCVNDAYPVDNKGHWDVKIYLKGTFVRGAK